MSTNQPHKVTTSYISESLPDHIRNLYDTETDEQGIKRLLGLAADLVQELIELRKSLPERERQAGARALMEAAGHCRRREDSPTSSYKVSDWLANRAVGLREGTVDK